MGAKTWMLVLAESDARNALAKLPELDRDATSALARALFPDETLEPLDDGDLSDLHPPDEELSIGCFPGVSIVAAKEFGIDQPSQLPPHFLAPAARGVATLHAMHSAVDWFAYAIWRDGVLVRALGLSPEMGIQEDLGERQSFELPFWAGEHPAVADGEYPFPFHPLELGEAALLERFGFCCEGEGPPLFELEEIQLARFRRRPASAPAQRIRRERKPATPRRPWWKLW